MKNNIQKSKWKWLSIISFCLFMFCFPKNLYAADTLIHSLMSAPESLGGTGDADMTTQSSPFTKTAYTQIYATYTQSSNMSSGVPNECYVYLYDGNGNKVGTLAERTAYDKVSVYTINLSDVSTSSSTLYVKAHIKRVSVFKAELKVFGTPHTHTWNAGTVTKAATCAATGVKTYTCTGCNTTKTETIPKSTTHTGTWQRVSGPTCTAAEVLKCSVCGATKAGASAKGHTYTLMPANS